MYKQKLLIMMAIATLTLSACATIEEKLTEKGATRLNAEQVKSHIVGNTERWTKGGGYYSSDGGIDVVWKGSAHTGKWQVSNKGRVCVQVPTWDEFCHHYLDNNGEITLIYKKDGSTRADVKEMFEGNQLSTL